MGKPWYVFSEAVCAPKGRAPKGLQDLAQGFNPVSV
jgi:hypothetical protein